MDFYGMTGERLGTIGQVEGERAKQANLPQWKKEFLEKPSISVRKGIAWGYSRPYENTSTLVLTSPASVFVDIRFPLQLSPSQPLSSNPTFWAFSGTSTTTFLEFSDPSDAEFGMAMPYSAHCHWVHKIDSKGPQPADEGDMFLLPNGDCMEVGIMLDPKTRTAGFYKEYWSSPDVEPGSGGLRKRPCVVAKTVLPGKVQGPFVDRSGVIIRVGNYCQGIVQHAQKDERKYAVSVERWVQRPVERNPALAASDSAEVGEVEWLKDWRSNTPGAEGTEVSLPCMWVCGENRKIGEEVVVHSVTWRIVEVVS